MLIAIDKIVETLLSHNKNSWQIMLISKWPMIIGDLHTRMRLEKIVQHSLIIGVYDQHWMHELFMLTPIIIKKINQYLGHECINKLIFKLIDQRQKESINNNKIQPIHHQKSDLAFEKKNGIFTEELLSQTQKSALMKIKDHQLQQLLYNILCHC